MDLANDISLGQITYHNKLTAGSLRYFGFGDIELRETGDPNGVPRTVAQMNLH
jgi:hypothetical protein